jgi:hypothetical protein
LNALFNGRFIITNAISLECTDLETLCYVAESSTDYIKNIQKLFEISFTENEIIKRKQILIPMYDNEKNARQLMKWL